MNFKRKKILIAFGLLFIVFIIIRTTGVLSNYRIATDSMAPTLKKNSSIITSNLLDFQVGDLIAFKSKNLPEPAIFRIVAKEGDTLQIRDGIVFRNGENIDINLSLVHNYKLPLTKLQMLRNSKQFYDDFELRRKIDLDTVVIDADDSLASSLNLQRLTYSKNQVDSEIKKEYSKNWNKDNFGPLIIKENKLFVLGDNRDNAYDSRFIGLIDENDLIGKKILDF